MAFWYTLPLSGPPGQRENTRNSTSNGRAFTKLPHGHYIWFFFSFFTFPFEDWQAAKGAKTSDWN